MVVCGQYGRSRCYVHDIHYVHVNGSGAIGSQGGTAVWAWNVPFTVSGLDETVQALLMHGVVAARQRLWYVLKVFGLELPVVA